MLKKTSKLLGLLLLLIFSFMYTNKVFSTAKNSNPVMKEIVKYKKEHDLQPTEPVINKDELILGYSGLIINKEVSYKNMKNKFDKNKIVYEDKLPKTTITKDYNYYIKQGNPKNKSVALIFKVENKDSVDNLLKYLQRQNIKASFFVDGTWLKENVEVAFRITDMGHDIYNLGYDGNYDKSTINITNNLIESITLKDSLYCLNDRKDDLQKKVCAKKNMLTLTSTLLDVSISDLKKGLINGAIISYSVKDFDNSNTTLIIRTITNKGYEIKDLNSVINEKRY